LAQLGPFKVVMAMQIRVAWFDLALPKVPLENWRHDSRLKIQEV